MRESDEGGIAGERHATEHDSGRFKIEDRLQERLAAEKNIRYLRREQRLRFVLDARDHLLADRWRRNPAAGRSTGRYKTML